MNSHAEALSEAAKGCFAEAFDGVLRIECKGDGSSFWVDGRAQPPVISAQAPANVTGRFCLWRGDAPTLSSVLSGQRRLETAYTAGQLKISGDMAVMARLELGTDT
ncbi:MAG: SCP2 sterol-binding domain-containing protein [Parvularculaceae bacterium]|nr:SCP2 sterol-binding domain-containing protein [Parvularculaceae bacterium]